MYNGLFQNKEKSGLLKKWLLIGGAVLLTLAVIGGVLWFALRPEQPAAAGTATAPAITAPAATEPTVTQQAEPPTTQPTTTQPTDTQPTATRETEAGQDTPAGPVTPEAYKLTCSKYFVYDMSTGTYLAQSGEESMRLYPASITKLFTIHVALQYLSPETVVTVGPEITMIDPDSTTADLQQGDTVSVDLLVGGMMLPSGNDAAYALAAAAGRVILDDPTCSAGTAVSGFVAEMNRQAQSLGMSGSHFANPDGIHHYDHYFSMADMVTLGRLSLNEPLVMKWAGTAMKTVQLGDRSITWKNTNMLVRSDLVTAPPTNTSYEPERLAALYCENAIGLKTGRTTPAGYCLLSAFQTGGRVLLIGVFGSDDSVPRCEDTLYLYNKATQAKNAEAQ